jgi:hypothetical protein
MKTEIVSYTLESMPQMTKEEVAELKAKLDDPNFKIDYSDIPRLTDEQWKNAARRRFHRSASPDEYRANSTNAE